VVQDEDEDDVRKTRRLVIDLLQRKKVDCRLSDGKLWSARPLPSVAYPLCSAVQQEETASSLHPFIESFYCFFSSLALPANGCPLFLSVRYFNPSNPSVTPGISFSLNM